MKTNTISLVISYYIFGGIEGVEAFASNDDAVKAFIKKVSAVAVPRGSELITTLEGAYEWLGNNEESLEISYSLQTSDVVVNDEQRDLIALADSLEKAVAADIYYYAADHDDQDACDQITEAKNAMLESAKVLRAYAHDSADNHASDEITTVVKLKNGILDEAKSFVSHKDAEAFFLLEVAKFEPSISDEDIEACLDNGSLDNNSGMNVGQLIEQLQKLDPSKLVTIVVGDEDENIVDTRHFELHATDDGVEYLEFFVPVTLPLK